MESKVERGEDMVVDQGAGAGIGEVLIAGQLLIFAAVGRETEISPSELSESFIFMCYCPTNTLLRAKHTFSHYSLSYSTREPNLACIG